VKTPYDQTIKELVLSLERHMEPHGEPVTLSLSAEAQESFYGVMDAVEKEMSPDGDCDEIRGWATKHPARIGRIAGLLHMVEHGMNTTVVSLETITAAARIGAYYMIQARRAYSQVRLDSDTQDAVYVCDRLRHHFSRHDAAESITGREIQRLCRRIKTKRELRPILDRLVDNGWIFPIDDSPDGPGRPKSRRYTVHAKMLPKPGPVAA
jgi:replicative DNA helicase